jgi:hypothetical protein
VDEEAAPASLAPPEPEEEPEDQAELERRNLNLRGLSAQDKGFDLLASPFSEDEAKKDDTDL